jgi:hypothetical protein
MQEVRFLLHLDWFRNLGLVFLHDFMRVPLNPLV